MSPEGELPTREVIRRDPTRATGLRPVRELAERTAVGDAYLHALIRAQIGLAIRMTILVVAALAGVPLFFLVEPRFRTTKLVGVPLAWIVIGVGLYPLFVIVAAAFVRRAERNEADFVDVVFSSQQAGRRR